MGKPGELLNLMLLLQVTCSLEKNASVQIPLWGKNSSQFLIQPLRKKGKTKENQSKHKLCSNIHENFQLQLGKSNLNHEHLSSALNLNPVIFILEPTWAKDGPILSHVNTRFWELKPKPCRNSCREKKMGCIREGRVFQDATPATKKNI